MKTQAQTSFTQKIMLMFLGLLLFLVLLETGLRLGAFVLSSKQERKNTASLKQTGTYRILCLGESTTVGEYPPFLAKILNQSGIGVTFSVIDAGVGGTNTTAIVAQLENNLDKYRPDLVVTMMGINDYGSHMPGEATPAASASRPALSLTSLRLYKLARLIWLHVATKIKQHPRALTKNERVSMDAGWRQLHQNRLVEAERSFKNALADNPRSDSAYLGLGVMYKTRKALNEAKQAFSKAIELNPQNYKAYTELGALDNLLGNYKEAEHSAVKAIELDPGYYRPYLTMGAVYCKLGKIDEAQQAFSKAKSLDPRNPGLYVELSRYYRFMGYFSDAEQALSKALELDPRHDTAYLELGLLYKNQGRFPEAEPALSKAIELNPHGIPAYLALASFYREHGNYAGAEKILSKAISYDKNNPQLYAALGSSCQDQGKPVEAEQAFKKAIELNPENPQLYTELGWFYRSRGKSSEAEQCFKKAVELAPLDSRVNRELDLFYRVQEKSTGTGRILQAAPAPETTYAPLTIANYLRLKEILDARKLTWVCVQYPVRSIEPLKKIFSQKQEIIFVDNEAIFIQAVLRDGAKEYFRDMFGGDFGHCTAKGNRLLAQNIARAILTEVFHQ